MNSPDIKPERSEALAPKKNRNIGGSSLLFVSVLGLLNLGGLLVLSLWFFNASGYQQEAGQSFVQRISGLEEQASNLNNTLRDSLDSTEDQIKFLNREVRKLWDLSNKKNRKNIDSLKSEIGDIQRSFEESSKQLNTLAAKLRAVSLEVDKLEKIKEDFNKKFLTISSLSNSEDIEKRITIQEESIEAFDSYRRQMNSKLLEIEKRIDQLQINIEESSVLN